MSTPSPQDVQALIDQGVASLEKVTGKFNPTGKNWAPALAAFAAARAEAGELVAPTPPPPPPPPPPAGVPPMPFYDLNHYSNADWDAIVAAGMPQAGFMGPLDASIVQHIGLKNQWLQIYNGDTEAGFQQYGVPCWQTGMVSTFVIWDEPDSSAQTIQKVLMVKGWVNQFCPGAKTAVTGYDPGTLTALIAANVADIYLVDNYPSRTGWDLASLKQCVAAVDGKVPYGIVLDAFTDGTANYPLPTAAELQSEIDYALTTNAEVLPVYAWPLDPSLQPVLKAYAS